MRRYIIRVTNNSLSTSRSKRTFRTNLKKYSEHLLKDSKHTASKNKGNIYYFKYLLMNLNIDGFSSDSFQKVLGVFLNTCTIKKIFNNDEDSDKIEEFNSLLYSYSHQKFYSYLSLPEVQFIIDIVFNEIGVEGFIERHRALSVNRDSYFDHINSVLMRL